MECAIPSKIQRVLCISNKCEQQRDKMPEAPAYFQRTPLPPTVPQNYYLIF